MAATHHHHGPLPVGGGRQGGLEGEAGAGGGEVGVTEDQAGADISPLTAGLDWVGQTEVPALEECCAVSASAD